MGTSLQRQDSINKPDSFDDQQSAAEVAGSEASSTNAGEFTEATLSQIKRLIHGNDSGNWHDDITTTFGRDASLKALLGLSAPLLTRDMTDDSTERIVVGDKTISRKIVVDYSYELPISKRAHVGVVTLNHDGTSVVADDDYTYVSPEIDGVAMSGDINGNDLRLVITNSALGEHPTITYKIASINVA